MSEGLEDGRVLLCCGNIFLAVGRKAAVDPAIPERTDLEFRSIATCNCPLPIAY